jgi:NADPH:quinone reductase-like Zn-dependent oxidoreductase
LKLEFMRSLGADHVIDYTPAGVTSNGRGYDLILDLAAHRSALAWKGSLVDGGRSLSVGGSVATLLQVLLVGPLLEGPRATSCDSWPFDRVPSAWGRWLGSARPEGS